jgi:hypothetical protein
MWASISGVISSVLATASFGAPITSQS